MNGKTKAKINKRFFLKRILYFFMAFFIAVGVIGASSFNKYGFFGLKANAESRYIDAVDSIKISNIYDKNMIYAAWSRYGAEIDISPENIKSGEEIWFAFEWSVKETDYVQNGDSFSIIFPDIFDHSRINTKSNAELRNDNGILVALYSIHEVSAGTKSITITFTEDAETLQNIRGTYGFSMFAVEFYEGESKPFTFMLNDIIINAGYIVGSIPPGGYYEYGDAKHGSRADPNQIIDGYYYFKWTVWVNFDFNIIENFSFDDIIPENSFHRFITDSSVAALGVTIPADKQYLYNVTVREYYGADSFPTREARYDKFQQNLNNIGDWYENLMETYTFVKGASTSYPLNGGDGGEGINLSNFSITQKNMYGNLGRLTRPIVIDYYTISEIKLSEAAIYDFDTTKQFENTISGTGINPMNAVLHGVWITEESNVSGVKGDYSFSFMKTDENQEALSGAVFSLYTDENCEEGASKFSQSDTNGAVVFKGLKADIYYIKETLAPDGYELSDKIYKVVLTENGFTISESIDPENTPVTFIMNIPEETETETENITEETTEDITKETTETTIAETTVTETSQTTDSTESTESTVTTTTSQTTTSETSVTTTTTAATGTTVSATTVTGTTSATVAPPVITELIPPVPDVTATVITETPSVLTSETMTVADNITLLPPVVVAPSVNTPETPNVYTAFTVPALPPGYSFLQTDDNIFEIIDENGVPLGYIVLPDGVSIDDIQYEDIIDMLIPYANIMLPDIFKPSIPNVTDIPVDPVMPDIPKEPSDSGVQAVPKTGDVSALSILILTSSSLVLFLILEKNIFHLWLKRANKK